MKTITQKILLATLTIFTFSCEAPDIQQAIDKVYISSSDWDFGENRDYSYGNTGTAALEAISEVDFDDSNGELNPATSSENNEPAVREVEQEDFTPRTAGGSGANYPRFVAISTRAYITRKGDSFDFTHTLAYEMDDEKIIITNEKFGSKKSRVDDALKKKIGTATIHGRATKEQSNAAYKRDAQVGDLFKFMISATSSRTGGNQFTFDLPIPVIPVPLSRGSMEAYIGKTYTLNVAVSGNINRTIKSKVSVESKGSSTILVTIEIDSGLSGDSRCEFFEKFPLSMKSSFTINTDSKTISQSVVNNCSMDDEHQVDLHAEYQVQRQD